MRELDLLAKIFRANPALPSRVTIPPGDDLAALKIDGGIVLVGVDQVIDGVHFELASTPLEKIARKAVTRNLSDVAAMAARPTAMLAAACLPKGFGGERAGELFEHMRLVAATYDCPLVGGDIAMWDHPLVISVTVLAEPDGVEPVTRSTARPGDVICVSGDLGGSLQEVDGRVHHLDFEPRLKIARSLACNMKTRPTSMIDLSDGLIADVANLCRSSNIAARIRVESVPVSRAAQMASAADGKPAWRHALADGEDYELCFTIPAEAAAQVPDAIDQVVISRVGRVRARGTDEPMIQLEMSDGSCRAAEDFGWEHCG